MKRDGSRKVGLGRSIWLGLQLLALSMPALGATNAFPDFTAQSALEYLRSVGRGVEAESADPQDAKLLEARILSAYGQQDEAIGLAREALALTPQRADLHAFLGEVLIKSEQLEEARDCFRAALANDPAHLGAQRQLGLVLDRLGDRDGAQRALETASTIDPKDPITRLVLGQLLLDRGQPEAALGHLTLACQLDPKSANPVYTLAQTQLRLGHRQEAESLLETFRKLKRAEQQRAEAVNATRDNERELRGLAATFHVNAATLLAQQGRLASAQAHLRQAITVAPHLPDAYHRLAALLVQSGKPAEAKPLLQQLVDIVPTNATYQLNLGTLLLQTGEPEAAVRHLERSLALDPNQPETLNNLARFYLGQQRELSKALDYSRRLAEMDSAAAHFDLLGWAAYANGRVKEARSATARAVELDPDNAVYRQHYRRLLDVTDSAK